MGDEDALDKHYGLPSRKIYDAEIKVLQEQARDALIQHLKDNYDARKLTCSTELLVRTAVKWSKQWTTPNPEVVDSYLDALEKAVKMEFEIETVIPKQYSEDAKLRKKVIALKKAELKKYKDDFLASCK